MIPQIAPEAPSEEVMKEFERTRNVREAMEPIAPEARYMARKLPRPISSWRRVPAIKRTAIFKPICRMLWCEKIEPRRLNA